MAPLMCHKKVIVKSFFDSFISIKLTFSGLISFVLLVDTLRLRQNDHHFAVILTCISNVNHGIELKFHPNLVQRVQSRNSLYRFGYGIAAEQGVVLHDDVIKWKHFPRYWPFVRRIHRSPVNSSHNGQWRGALMLSLICAWINGWVNNLKADDLWRAHFNVTVMELSEPLMA